MIRVYTCFPVPGPYGSTNVLGIADGTSIELDGPNNTVVVTFGYPYTNLGKLVIPGTNIAAVQVIDEPGAEAAKPAEPEEDERCSRCGDTHDGELTMCEDCIADEKQIDAELAVQAQSDDPLASVDPADTQPATPEAKRKAKR